MAIVTGENILKTLYQADFGKKKASRFHVGKKKKIYLIFFRDDYKRVRLATGVVGAIT